MSKMLPIAVSALLLATAPGFAQDNTAQPATTTTTTTTQPAATATTTAQPAATTTTQAAGGAAGGQQQGGALAQAATTLQQAAQALQDTAGGDATQATQGATTALDQFQQAVQQGGQGQAMQPMIDQARQQLQSDPQQAVGTLQQLAAQAQQQAGMSQTANIPPDADHIVGRTVVTQNGEEGGEIRDVLVTPDGKVSALLVGSGGVLGMGDRQVAIPWDQVKLNGDQFSVNMTAEQIQNMPEYKTD